MTPPNAPGLVRCPIRSSFGSLVARSTFFAKSVALEILFKNYKQKETLTFLTVLLFFRDFTIRLLISKFGMQILRWKVVLLIGCPCLTHKARISWWSLGAWEIFNLMPIKNLPENMHQRPHLEQFWEPGGQEHILDKSGWIQNFAKELQTRN